jgi:hypothetical protein
LPTIWVAPDPLKAGGPVSMIACGTINASLKQIKKAPTSGTNDWYQCIFGVGD